MSIGSRWSASTGCILALSLLNACKSSPQPSVSHNDALAADVVARVGADSIVRASVQRIVDSRQLAPASALQLAVSDALFSERAKHDLAQSRLPSYLERLALTRALLDQIKAEAMDLGAATDQEIAAIALERWWDFERPELHRTTHAVVLLDKNVSDAVALALAQKIHDTVPGVTDPKEFRSRVEAINAAPLKIKVEDLPPVARDGRTLILGNTPQPGSPFEPAFAEAAMNLVQVGALSPVVRSEAGYHVILLTEIIPPQTVPREEQRSRLQEEALLRRTKNSYREARDAVHAKASINISPQAQALMASIQARP